jgi:Cys-rich four helix bundle protein (predicted Tat secretion target)
MNRRQVVQVTAGTAIAHGIVTVLGCKAEQKPANAPASAPNKDKGQPHAAAVAPAASPVTQPLAKLAGASAECVRAGEACLEHCIRHLSTGSTMMADCAKIVQQMLAVCRAASSLSAMGSKYAATMAKLCAEACRDCAKVCEPHAGHHAECKACLEACRVTEAAARGVG